ncbi:MAG: hypothetical protein HY561_09125 [Gemmatimonadetes bacterium]|nr:hypothetical protein [Gemmatimonadota bacterium]
MASRGDPGPGLDFFWEQADVDGSREHPLERELCDRLDALARYGRLIDEAESGGREEAAEVLLRHHARQAAEVARLREALARSQRAA